eukprot:scaffold2505_cov82-Skeletonema_dohrnii-CCMP3373.AAC.4
MGKLELLWPVFRCDFYGYTPLGSTSTTDGCCGAEGPELKGALICMDPFNLVALWSLTYIFGYVL